MLVYREIFDSGVRKVCSFPFKGNNAIIALGKSLGAKTEGILRGQTLRHGQPVDLVILSLFKEDFDAVYSPVSPGADRGGVLDGERGAVQPGVEHRPDAEPRVTAITD
jgi:hypothetical protein